ncbi:MAG TPA: hypothetical protein VKA46_10765 [Gemmataceae bacterium]|nr:hypothetical protein [Gemmataceae bacterium]
MLPSVRAFLSGIIDYAGLFPPAKLPLDQAIRNYAEYRAGSDAWMLGRFVVPVARLAELEAHAGLFQQGAPWVFSALGQGGDTLAEFVAGLDADLDAITAFQERHGERVVVDVIELRLPRWEKQTWTFWDLAEATGSFVTSPFLPGLTPVFERPLSPDWRSSILSAINFADQMRPTGFKLRCGGLEASAIPSPEQVALAIYYAIDCGVPLKFTAGLHHPIRHFNSGVQAKMHGFLNVFGAAVLARVRAFRLAEDQLREIIEDEDAAHFAFDETGFRWKQYHVPTDTIVTARRWFVLSFGSCSFDEPRDDLRAMGILS